jgi:hypothetical protein
MEELEKLKDEEWIMRYSSVLIAVIFAGIVILWSSVTFFIEDTHRRSQTLKKEGR